MHLVVGRGEAYKYTRMENPWGAEGGRLWRRRSAAGLRPQLAKGLDAQKCSRYPAQPGNSLSRKGNSEMPKMILLFQPPSPVHVCAWASGIHMHVCVCVWIWKKEKNLPAKREDNESGRQVIAISISVWDCIFSLNKIKSKKKNVS